MSSTRASGILVVNPTSGAPAAAASLRAVLDALAGRTVGFFSNNKPNAVAVLERIEEQLAARFQITPRHYVKPVPSLAADGALLDEIARDCDAVVLAGFD